MIINAIRRAYDVKKQREWDTIYWAIDLHGVCLISNYEQGGYTWINKDALEGLKAISARPESKIILWSSVYEHEKKAIEDFFNEHGIIVDDFNKNEREKSNKVSCFDQKFYFSVLLDDKAGFDPEHDWRPIIQFMKELEMKDLGFEVL